jgi:hypothetical protein
MMARIPQNNALALERLSKISTLNPVTTAGYLIISSLIFDKDKKNQHAVGEWNVVGYFKKSRILLLVPSLTNTLSANQAFESNVISRKGDVLKVHANITNHQNIIFHSYPKEISIYTANRHSKEAKNIKVA